MSCKCFCFLFLSPLIFCAFLILRYYGVRVWYSTGEGLRHKIWLVWSRQSRRWTVRSWSLCDPSTRRNKNGMGQKKVLNCVTSLILKTKIKSISKYGAMRISTSLGLYPRRCVIAFFFLSHARHLGICRAQMSNCLICQIPRMTGIAILRCMHI